MNHDNHLKDDGCHVWPHCLTCPLERCIFDKVHKPHDQGRYEAMTTAYARLGTQAAVAKEFGVSRRTVWRALKRRAPR